MATDLNMDKLQELQKEYPGMQGGGALTLAWLKYLVFVDIQIDRLDVTDEDNVRSVIKKYTADSDGTHKLNTLFNCAG